MTTTRCRSLAALGMTAAVAAGVLLASQASAQAPRVIAPPIDRYFQLARAEYSGERARDLVAYMDGTFRWPGNSAFDRSLDRVILQLREAGYVPEDSATKASRLTYRVE